MFQVKLKCLSHTPLKGLNDPGVDIVREVDAELLKARQEIEDFDPELVLVFAPDHFNGLFYDLMPPFVIAAGAESVGDYGTLAGSLSVESDCAANLAQYVLNNEIDIAISYRLQVDHGCAQTLEEITGSLSRYPVVPIIINCVAPPFSPYRRIRMLGEVIGQYIRMLNKRVLILGSGGLSHEPPVPTLCDATEEVAERLISGRNPSLETRKAREDRTVATGKVFGTPDCALTPLNPLWDRNFISMLVDGRLHEVDDFDIDDISKVAGRSAHEVRTWVAAFSALQGASDGYSANQNYYRAIDEWIAGYAILSAE